MVLPPVADSKRANLPFRSRRRSSRGRVWDQLCRRNRRFADSKRANLPFAKRLPSIRRNPVERRELRGSGAQTRRGHRCDVGDDYWRVRVASLSLYSVSPTTANGCSSAMRASVAPTADVQRHQLPTTSHNAVPKILDAD